MATQIAGTKHAHLLGQALWRGQIEFGCDARGIARMQGNTPKRRDRSIRRATRNGFWTCFSRAAMDGSLFRSSVAAVTRFEIFGAALEQRGANKEAARPPSCEVTSGRELIERSFKRRKPAQETASADYR